MRLIIAVLRPSQVESVRHALATVHVTRLTVCDAHGYDLATSDGLAQEAVLEIAVNEDYVDRTVATIAAAVALGGETEPRLHVVPMHEAVQIYRAVRGPEAV